MTPPPRPFFFLTFPKYHLFWYPVTSLIPTFEDKVVFVFRVSVAKREKLEIVRYFSALVGLEYCGNTFPPFPFPRQISSGNMERPTSILWMLRGRLLGEKDCGNVLPPHPSPLSTLQANRSEGEGEEGSLSRILDLVSFSLRRGHFKQKTPPSSLSTTWTNRDLIIFFHLELLASLNSLKIGRLEALKYHWL